MSKRDRSDRHSWIVERLPFFLGLPGYSQFAYADLFATARSVSCTLENTGSVAATETPQLYLRFPASVGEPPWQLKGFEKTTLAPGAKATVTFQLARERPVKRSERGPFS